MRQMSPEELAMLDKAERRRAAAEHHGLRRSAANGTIQLLDDVLAAIALAPPKARVRLEPQLLERKAVLLRTRNGLTPAVELFRVGYTKLLDDLLEQL